MTTFRIKTVGGEHLECVSEPIARGGLGEVYQVIGEDRVAKLLKKEDAAARDRLHAVVHAYDPRWLVPQCDALSCWPDAVVVTPQLGVTMPKAPARFRKLDDFQVPTPLRWFHGRSRGGSTPSYARRVDVALELLDAVHVLHELGLCHSDLSPNNVIVDLERGEVRVIDLDGLVVPGFLAETALGTPHYMAPELHDRVPGAAPSIVTDLHALAVLLHELLLLHSPFEGKATFVDDPDDTLQDEALRYGCAAIWNLDPNRADNRPYDPIVIAPSHLDPRLVELFHRALVLGVTDPGHRPSAADWLEAVGDLRDRFVPCSNPACGLDGLPWRAGPMECWLCQTPVVATVDRPWSVVAIVDAPLAASASAPAVAGPAPAEALFVRSLVVEARTSLRPRHIRPGWSAAPSANRSTLSVVATTSGDGVVSVGSFPPIFRALPGRPGHRVQGRAPVVAGTMLQWSAELPSRGLAALPPTSATADLGAPTALTQRSPPLEVLVDGRPWRELRPLPGGRGVLLDASEIGGGPRGHTAGRIYYSSRRGYCLRVYPAPAGHGVRLSCGSPLEPGTYEIGGLPSWAIGPHEIELRLVHDPQDLTVGSPA